MLLDPEPPSSHKPQSRHSARLHAQLKGVQRAGGSSGSDFQDMGIDRRRAHIRMPLQFLHRAHVGARLQQVRGKAVVHGGAQAIVFVTKSLTDLVQQSYGVQHRRGGGFHG